MANGIETTCSLCGKRIGKNDEFHYVYPDGVIACYECCEYTKCFLCDDCNHYWLNEYLHVCDDGDWLCPKCLGTE